MRPAPSLLTPHRRARYIAWARLALLWAGAALFGVLNFKRRHIRRRYGWLSLDGLERMVCNLALIRAVELARLPLDEKPRRVRDFVPHGFHRREVRCCTRTIVGGRLRRYLRAADAQARIARLLDALADLDAFARRHFLKRAKRGLSRLRPIVAVRPPPAAFTSAETRAPKFADSS